MAPSGSRYIPISWIPRWTDPYYNQDSVYRKMMFSSLLYWNERNSQTVRRELGAAFYGPEGQSRAGWTARYHFPTAHIPQITLVSPCAESPEAEVMPANSMGNMLYESARPLWSFDADGSLIFKNLEVVEFSTQPTTGSINLLPMYSIHPRVEDSPLVLTNDWGDEEIIDPISTRLTADGRLLTPYTENQFTVRYLSQRLRTALTTGSAWITIGEERITLLPKAFINGWDELASVYGLERQNEETNTGLKRRIQHSALALSPEQLLSAALGASEVLLWATQNALNLTGSSVTSVRVVELDDAVYVQGEQPVWWGGGWQLTNVPVASSFQLFYRDTSVLSTSYIVTGSTVVPLTLRLAQAEAHELRAAYKVQLWTATGSGLYTTGLQPQNTRPESRFVLLAKNVKIEGVEKRVRTWKWNAENEGVTGSAKFS